MMAALVIQGCQSSTSEPLRIVAVDRSEATSGTLSLISPVNAIKPGDNELSFDAGGFELRALTQNKRSGLLSNSTKGQHIHLIIDNQPYMVEYDERFLVSLDSGEHTLVAFLSRSYHESVKEAGASIWKRLLVSNTETLDLPINGPQLIYSRPKGEYKVSGNEAPILLDFYLLNTDLSDGHYVLAKINGNEFKITEWKPHYIYGLVPGEHMLSLQLMDAGGQPVPGHTNYSGTRKFRIVKH